MKILRVFCNSKGEFGNPVGIVEDLEKKVNKKTRQRMATTSGFSEIVFVNDLEKRDISIFSPTRQTPFAGHAIVGVSYYLRHVHGLTFDAIISMGKTINTWEEHGMAWTKTEISNLPDWNFREFNKPEDVDNLTLDSTRDFKHTLAWSWIDKKNGTIRARTFARDWKIPEDEANGSGAMLLVKMLQRNLIIHHGKGSIVQARPSKSNSAIVGGLVKPEAPTG